MVVDHIVALSLGGDNEPDNLCPSCTACNDAKSKAERAYLAKRFDPQDILFDPNLSPWINTARSYRPVQPM